LIPRVGWLFFFVSASRCLGVNEVLFVVTIGSWLFPKHIALSVCGAPTFPM
jgi:hypothetical protein